MQLSMDGVRVLNRNLSRWQNCRSRWIMNYSHQRCKILGGIWGYAPLENFEFGTLKTQIAAEITRNVGRILLFFLNVSGSC